MIAKSRLLAAKTDALVEEDGPRGMEQRSIDTMKSCLPAFLLACGALLARADVGSFDLPMKKFGLMPAIEVMVNGRGPYLFAIDTGASGSGRADTTLVEELALPVVGEARSSDGGSGPARVLPVVRVEKLEIAGMSFGPADLASRNYNEKPGLERIHGILGFGLFKKGVLTLDYPKGRVRYERDAALPEPDGKTILTLGGDRVAALEVRIAGEAQRARLDSGNMVGRFVLPTAAVEKLQRIGEPAVVGKARTVSGEIEIKKVAIADTISLGQYEFPREEVVFPAPGGIVNIGGAVLREFCVSFDQANGRLRLEKP